MIHRLRKVADGLYRGSAPTPKDVLWLKEHLGISKIVSLDHDSGERIDRACQLLGIQHVKMYISWNKRSLLNLLHHDLKKLLLDDGPTFVHCAEGKDRTGLLIGLFKCMYLGVDPEDAIHEAKTMGFGHGIPPEVTHLYEKLIRQCKTSKDNNSADIVSNEREYKGDNRDSFLDEGHQGSFAPYLDHTKMNPMDAVYVYNNDQSPDRENYQQTWEEPKKRMLIKDLLKMLLDGQPISSYIDDKESIPQVGVYNNDAGQKGFGPTENYSGFFYD